VSSKIFQLLWALSSKQSSITATSGTDQNEQVCCHSLGMSYLFVSGRRRRSYATGTRRTIWTTTDATD